MKAKYIFILLLLPAIAGYNSLLSQRNQNNYSFKDLYVFTSALPTEHKRSENLIDKFNTLRILEGLPSIRHDTVLDNISKILLIDETRSFKKAQDVYNEDSVRLLLYEKGIISVRDITESETGIYYSI